MIEQRTGSKQQGSKNMRAVVHTHKDNSEVMKAFAEKRANIAIGYVRNCNAAEIKFLRHELYSGTANS